MDKYKVANEINRSIGMVKAHEEAKIMTQPKKLTAERLKEISTYVSNGEWNEDGALLEHIAALDEEIADLSYSGVHTCHANCKNWACILRREKDTLKAALERAEEVMKEVRTEMHDAACAIQVMKDGYDDPEMDPFGRLRALKHSFFGNRNAGLRLDRTLTDIRKVLGKG